MRYQAGKAVAMAAVGQDRARVIPPILVREVLAPLAFVASIIVTSYALAFLPNVKLFDLMVFVAGYTLGLRRGATVAVASWAVYGTLNPWGPTTGPLLITVMGAETLYALAGAGVRWLLPPGRVRLGPGLATLLFGVAALVATGLYDLVTNVYTGVVWAQVTASDDLGRWIWVMLTHPGAVFFYVLHVGSNLAFFTTLGPAMVKAVDKGERGPVVGKPVRVWPFFALPALLAGVMAACTTVESGLSSTPTPAPTHTVHMLIEPDPDLPQWFRDVEVPQGYDAYQLTELVTGGDLEATWYPSFRSHLVESIRGVKNEGSRFWLVYLWDESNEEWTLLPVGADWFSLKDGHTLAWSYADTGQSPAHPPAGRP